MNFTLNPKNVFKILSLFVVFLLIANLIGIGIRSVPGHGSVEKLIQIFDFNTEQNLPTLYSSLSLMFSAFLLLLIAIQHKSVDSPYLHWLGLAIIFAFLSIDETASLHEKLGDPVREYLNTSGLLFYAWVIPYMLALGMIILIYAKFLTRLPKRTMSLFIISGVIFVAGAIGCELLSGLQFELHGTNNALYRLIYTCEEFFEMFSIVIFIYALFDYMTSKFGSVKFTIEGQK